MTMKKHINLEMIAKLAGYGPYHAAPPTQKNLDRLADPTVSLSGRVDLLQALGGGPIHYEEAAAILDEDPQRVMAAKSFILDDNLGDSITSMFDFGFGMSSTPHAALVDYYGEGYVIDAHAAGEVGAKILRRAGIEGQKAELWAVSDLLGRYLAWVIQSKYGQWRAADEREWMSLQLVTQRPKSAKEAVEVAFNESLPDARCVGVVQDAELLPQGVIRAEAWMISNDDRGRPTWVTLRLGGYWTFGSPVWEHLWREAI